MAQFPVAVAPVDVGPLQISMYMHAFESESSDDEEDLRKMYP